MIASLKAWWYRLQAASCRAHADACDVSARMALESAEEYRREACMLERAAKRAESRLTGHDRPNMHST